MAANLNWWMLHLTVCVLLVSQVQTLLQQMQDKFQTMSDQIIGRNILPYSFKMSSFKNL